MEYRRTHSQWMRHLLTQYANNSSSTAGVQVKRRMKNEFAGSGYFKTLGDPIFQRKYKMRWKRFGSWSGESLGVVLCKRATCFTSFRAQLVLQWFDYAAFSSWVWPHFAFYQALIKCFPAWAIISNKWPGTSAQALHRHHTEQVKEGHSGTEISNITAQYLSFASKIYRHK